MRRRKVGPAYEQSPVRKFREWFNRNLLIFIASFISCVCFWLFVNFLVDYLFNLLATGGDELVEQPFSSDDTMWILLKLVGSFILVISIIKSRAK